MKTLLALLLLIPSLCWAAADNLESNHDEFCNNLKYRIDGEISILNFMYKEMNELRDIDDGSLEYFEDKLFKSTGLSFFHPVSQDIKSWNFMRNLKFSWEHLNLLLKKSETIEKLNTF